MLQRLLKYTANFLIKHFKLKNFSKISRFARGTDMDRIVDSNNGKELHGNVLEIKIAERPRKSNQPIIKFYFIVHWQFLIGSKSVSY